MSKWAITDGAAGRPCILPVGPIVDARLPYGYVIHEIVECNGLLEAMEILHEYEMKVVMQWQNTPILKRRAAMVP